MTPAIRTSGRPARRVLSSQAFRKSGLPLLLICTSTLAGCATFEKPPEIEYDDAPPAVFKAEPPGPVRIVALPKPLPLPGQLKPVGRDGKA